MKNEFREKKNVYIMLNTHKFGNPEGILKFEDIFVKKISN